MKKKVFAIRRIVNPQITFENFNNMKNKPEILCEAIIYNTKNNVFISYENENEISIENKILIFGKFDYAAPYLLYKSKIKQFKRANRGIVTYKLENILEVEKFKIDNTIFYGVPRENDKFTIIKGTALKYMFNMELKIKNKNHDKKTLKFINELKGKKEKKLKQIKNSEELYKIFYEKTYYYKISNSLMINKIFKPIFKTKFSKLLLYDEQKKMNDILQNNPQNIFQISDQFIFETSLENIVYFLKIWIETFYRDKIEDIENAWYRDDKIYMSFNNSLKLEVLIKKLKEFVMSGVILYVLSKEIENKNIYVEIEKLKELVPKELKNAFELLKGIKIENREQHMFLSILKDNMNKLSVISSEFNNSISNLNNHHICIYGDEVKKIYLKKYFGFQIKICNFLNKILDNISEYEKNEDMSKFNKIYNNSELSLLNEKQKLFVKISVTKFYFSYYILRGKAGAGKTTTIKEIVRLMLQIENNNVLLCSFQGSTKYNLYEKIVKKLFGDDEPVYESYVMAMTIHKFINSIKKKKEVEKNKKLKRIDANEIYNIEDESDEHFELFCKDLKVIIIDEISNVSLKLFQELIDAVSVTAIKIIMVGDEKQCLSNEIGNIIIDMISFVSKYSENNIVTLTDNKRFDNEDDENYIIDNMNMIYNESDTIYKDFKHEPCSPVSICEFDNLIKFQIKSEIIFEKHKNETIQMFTFKNDSVNSINNFFLGNDKVRIEVEEENQIYYDLYDKIILDGYKFQFGIGDKILITKNSNHKILNNCYILTIEALGDINEHIRLQKINYSHFCYKYKNISDIMNRWDDKININTIESSYCANGTCDYISKIEYGVQFIPKEGDNNAIIKNGSKISIIKKKYIPIPIKVIHLHYSNEIIIIGTMCIKESDIHSGICRTIDSMQGLQTEIGILYIPNLKVEYDFYCINRLLVALTRSMKRLYIFMSGKLVVNHEKLGIMMNNLKNKDVSWMKDILDNKREYYKPTEFLQYMIFNHQDERKSDLSDLLTIKMKKRSFDQMKDVEEVEEKNKKIKE